jgi:hypothetical protein
MPEQSFKEIKALFTGTCNPGEVPRVHAMLSRAELWRVPRRRPHAPRLARRSVWACLEPPYPHCAYHVQPHRALEGAWGHGAPVREQERLADGQLSRHARGEDLS